MSDLASFPLRRARDAEASDDDGNDPAGPGIARPDARGAAAACWRLAVRGEPASGAPHGKGPQMADIIELILADHERIRRLLRALDGAARYGEDTGASWVLALV
jgi:hypothetical protein